MKCAILAALLVVSFAALVLADSAYYYAPEYTNYEQAVDATGTRNKRSATGATAFLVGVTAGGILGPILYNRLYGWKPVKAWPEPAWQEPQGWAEPAPQGWAEPAPQGWSAPAKGGY